MRGLFFRLWNTPMKKAALVGAAFLFSPRGRRVGDEGRLAYTYSIKTREVSLVMSS